MDEEKKTIILSKLQDSEFVEFEGNVYFMFEGKIYYHSSSRFYQLKAQLENYFSAKFPDKPTEWKNEMVLQNLIIGASNLDEKEKKVRIEYFGNQPVFIFEGENWEDEELRNLLHPYPKSIEELSPREESNEVGILGKIMNYARKLRDKLNRGEEIRNDARARARKNP
jgi:hypothetical protein